MKTKEIQTIFDAAIKRVTVRCDEMHAHSAREGCLGGDKRDVSICMLAEQLLEDRENIRDLIRTISE